MSTVFDRNISESFALDEKRVRSLAKILQNYAGEPSISVTCADDATRSFENVEKLLEYQNAKSRRITSLYMRSFAVGHEREKTASIHFATMMLRLARTQPATTSSRNCAWYVIMVYRGEAHGLADPVVCQNSINAGC